MKLFSKKIKLFLLLAFITSLLLFTALSCDTTEPKENMQVQLTELDASCTEAWLKLSAAAPVNPTVKIKTGDRIVFEGILTTSDTMIYVDSLSPSTDY
ncbi:MAG: hypothetical protein K9J16_16035, partial [Melioribacteraceae bacterium]|nr:hypothetical protein [Melioribacteraceae bacterium]